MAISIKEAQRLGLIPRSEPLTKSKKPKEITHWTRSNLKDWNGPHDWHVGIARQLREGVMIDLVVAWQGDVPKIHELVVWSEFVKWNIEETEARLNELGDSNLN